MIEPIEQLLGRAMYLMRLHGRGHHYLGMGLWSYGYYDSGRLLINHNADRFSVCFNGAVVYSVETGSHTHSLVGAQIKPKVLKVGSESLIRATLDEIDRILVLDDLSVLGKPRSSRPDGMAST